jgi:threonine dehydrogenase-like Zn-dependent dehydrogenase
VRAVIFQGPGQPLSVAERPVPVPRGDEIAVRVRRSGICAPDVRLVHRGGDDRRAPHAFGPCGWCAQCRAAFDAAVALLGGVETELPALATRTVGLPEFAAAFASVAAARPDCKVLLDPWR